MKPPGQLAGASTWGKGTWIQGSGLSEQNLGETGGPHPPPALGMVRKANHYFHLLKINKVDSIYNPQ